MTRRKKTWVKIAAALILIPLATLAVFGLHREKTETPIIMTPAEVKDPVRLSKEFDISLGEATDIARAIETATEKPPEASWTVEAKSTKEAARIVSEQIEKKTAPPMPPADKTVVTPKETKVDVYRIDMDADWEIGIGYGNHKGRGYVPIEIQRNYAKHKAVAAEIHMDTGSRKVEGYEIKHVWRF